MFGPKSLTVSTCLAVLLICLSSSLYYSPVAAQTSESIAKLKQHAIDLTKQTKYTEALPLLEKIVTAEPENAEMQFYLGFALVAQAANTSDEVQRKALRVRARDTFVKSKRLGIREPVVNALIQAIPLDGADAAAFSQDIAANSLMTEAEALFSQGGDFAQAEGWYKRAIAIDPNRETAYRYSATPLMKQGKTEAARDCYVEAFITEPYNQFARAGLIQWAEATETPLANPDIDIPTDVTLDDKGNAKVNLNANALLSGKDDVVCLDLVWRYPFGMAEGTIRQKVSAGAGLSPQFAGRSR